MQCKLKVKCTLVQALRLCTGRTAYRGSRGTALLFLDHGGRRGWRSASSSGRFLPQKRPSTHCTGGWLGLRAGLDRCGKSRPHRDSIPNRPARNQSLYRLSYLAQRAMCTHRNFICCLSAFPHFSTLSHTWHDFRGKKVNLSKRCRLIFSTTFIRKFSSPKKNTARHHKCAEAFT